MNDGNQALPADSGRLDPVTRTLSTHPNAPREMVDAYLRDQEEGSQSLSLAHRLFRDGHISSDELQRALEDSATEDFGGAKVAEMVSLSPGTMLGKYKLLREIGRGGMGVVYEARDPALDRIVAIKTLTGKKGDEDSLKRFHREGALAAGLSHPGIVNVFDIDVGLSGGELVHYIAMEKIEGQDLADVLPTMGQDARLQSFEQIVEAVSHAHAHGVIHRDLKPANVIVTGDGRSVVTDFGLARSLEDEIQLTQTGAVIGTALYMAPEQVEGRKNDLGTHTDVWALGVMLYEMLTDRLPYEGATHLDVFTRILDSDPISPRRHRPQLTRDLEAICLHALEKDPSRRYEDAGAMLADLRRWREGKPVTGRPPSALYRLRLGVQRRMATISVVAIVVLLGTALGLTLLNESHTQSATANAIRQVHLQADEHLTTATRPAQSTLHRLAAEVSGGMYDTDRSAFRTLESPAGSPPDQLALSLARNLGFEETFSWVTFSTPEGDFVGARRDPESGAITVHRSWISDDESWASYGVEGNRLARRESEGLLQDGYDPRKRPFYENAVTTDGIAWTGPYPFWSGAPGVTASLAVSDESGELRGVLGVDFEFSSLEDALGEISLAVLDHKETPFTGSLWITTPSGAVVADSQGELLDDIAHLTGEGSEARLPLLLELDRPLVQAMRSALDGRELSTIADRPIAFSHTAKPYEAAVLPLSLDDLPLHAVILVSCSEILAIRPWATVLAYAVWISWGLAALACISLPVCCMGPARTPGSTK